MPHEVEIREQAVTERTLDPFFVNRPMAFDPARLHVVPADVAQWPDF